MFTGESVREGFQASSQRIGRPFKIQTGKLSVGPLLGCFGSRLIVPTEVVTSPNSQNDGQILQYRTLYMTIKSWYDLTLRPLCPSILPDSAALVTGSTTTIVKLEDWGFVPQSGLNIGARVPQSGLYGTCEKIRCKTCMWLRPCLMEGPMSYRGTKGRKRDVFKSVIFPMSWKYLSWTLGWKSCAVVMQGKRLGRHNLASQLDVVCLRHALLEWCTPSLLVRTLSRSCICRVRPTPESNIYIACSSVNDKLHGMTVRVPAFCCRRSSALLVLKRSQSF